MDYKEHALYREPEMHTKWTREDLDLINDDSKWTVYKKATRRIPKSGTHGKSPLTDDDYETVTDIAYKYVAPDSPIWWIKVVGQVNDAELANIDDLLDASIKERQPEWHHLYVGGSILEQVTEGVEVCIFQYKSPIFLVAPRDTCYAKVRRHLDANGRIEAQTKPQRGHGGGAGGFLLTYRSVDDHPGDKPDKKYVRIGLKSSHRITPKPDGKPGFIYTCLQHADAKMWATLSNGPQASIMLDEINGVRKAVLNPIRQTHTESHTATSTPAPVAAAAVSSS